MRSKIKDVIAMVWLLKKPPIRPGIRDKAKSIGIIKIKITVKIRSVSISLRLLMLMVAFAKVIAKITSHGFSFFLKNTKMLNKFSKDTLFKVKSHTHHFRLCVDFY